MPISICYTDNELGIAASTTTNFANAIRFAANNGARVINNSSTVIGDTGIEGC